MLTRWNYRAPDVWNDMSRLSREMNRLFGEARDESISGVFPSMNLYDDDTNLVVRAEIPGIDPKDLEINATSNSLTVKGERKKEEAEEKASYHRKERGYGSFSRSMKLPHEIDADKVKASYELGVLEITLPKAEEAKPRKVKIDS